MYADCAHDMIFDGGDSIGRLILGESLVLGSTKDNSIVAFFVLRVCAEPKNNRGIRCKCYLTFMSV